MKTIFYSTIIIIGMILLNNPFGLSHEGHQHMETKKVSQHGGLVLQGKFLDLEYVVIGSDIKIYLRDKNNKKVTLTEADISGSLERPKVKNEEKIKFTLNSEFIQTQIDFKGKHRVLLKMNIKTNTINEQFKIQLENE